MGGCYAALIVYTYEEKMLAYVVHIAERIFIVDKSGLINRS